MNEILYTVLVFIAGLVLGTLFFGGLWFTVMTSITSKTPALWIISSFFVRVGLTMLGFFVARFVVTYITKPKAEMQIQIKKGGQ